VIRWKIEKVPYFRTQYNIMQKLTKAMSDGGVSLLVGTDPLVTGVLPGFAMEDELDDLVGAGLMPYQVLHAHHASAMGHICEVLQGGSPKGEADLPAFPH
jgi:hypothetical protein